MELLATAFPEGGGELELLVDEAALEDVGVYVRYYVNS